MPRPSSGSNPGALRVRLSHAIGLRSMDSNGYSDPYVKLVLGSDKHKSEIVKKTLNPRWDKDFFFRGSFEQLITTPLEVQVWDWDRFSRNDAVGNGKVNLGQLTNLVTGQPIEVSVQLKDEQATPGEVFLVVQWQPDGGITHAPPKPLYGSPACALPTGHAAYPPHSPAAHPYSGGAHNGAHHHANVPPRAERTFRHFDTNNSGFLDYGELRNALRHYGLQHFDSDERAASVVRRYDDHPDGKLEIVEFAELVRDLEAGVIRKEGARLPYDPASQVPARVSAAFDAFDGNGSGYIDYRELRGALRYYGLPNASEADARELVRAYDDHPDGKLDRLEFASLVKDLESGHVRRDGRTPTAAYPPARREGRRSYERGAPSPSRQYGGWAASSSRPPAHGGGASCCGGVGGGMGGGSSTPVGEQLGKAGGYLLDVAFRTLCFASVTAWIVAPDRLREDADVAAHAVGQDSVASLLATTPAVVFYMPLALLGLLLLATALNSCFGRRGADECFGALGRIISCCSCGPCVRCWRACFPAERFAESRYGGEARGIDPEYGLDRYRAPYRPHRSGLY